MRQYTENQDGKPTKKHYQKKGVCLGQGGYFTRELLVSYKFSSQRREQEAKSQKVCDDLSQGKVNFPSVKCLLIGMPSDVHVRKIPEPSCSVNSQCRESPVFVPSHETLKN